MQASTGWDVRSLFSFFPFAVLSASLVLLLIPVIQLLRRTGHHPIWCLLAIVLGLKVLGLWIFAFKSWPTDKANKEPGLTALPPGV